MLKIALYLHKKTSKDKRNKEKRKKYNKKKKRWEI